MNKTEHDLLMSFDPEYAAKQEGIKKIRKLLLKDMADEYRSNPFLIYFLIILQATIAVMQPNTINTIALTVNLFIYIVPPLFTFLFRYISCRKEILEL